MVVSNQASLGVRFYLSAVTSVILLISFYSCSVTIHFLDVCLILTTLTYTSEAFYLLAVQTISPLTNHSLCCAANVRTVRSEQAGVLNRTRDRPHQPWHSNCEFRFLEYCVSTNTHLIRSFS